MPMNFMTAKMRSISEGFFKAETMEDLLIALLACRIHGKTKNIGLSPNGGFLALKLAADVFRGKSFEDERLKDLIDGLNKDLNSTERYKKIDEKAKQILDLSGPYEKNIYEMLMYYTHLTFLVDYADPKEYQGMQRYMEGIAKYDAFDVLRKFLTM